MSKATEHIHKGDLLVVPGHGVGQVEDVEEIELEGTTLTTLRLHLRVSDSRIWVPLAQVEEQGLRPPMTATQAEEVLEIVSREEAPERLAHWNQRQRRYREQLLSNRPSDLARLLGELAAVRARKALSFTEKKMFRKVEKLLVGELATALEVSEDQVGARLSARLPDALAA